MPCTARMISDAALYRYDLPLTSPLDLGDTTLTHRRGGLVRVETDEGHVGWGDAAPLPGFSSETLREVEEHARTVLPHWMERTPPDPQGDFKALLREIPFGADSPPSLRFALESAVVDVVAAARQTAVPAMLGTPRRTVALNALLSRSEANAVEQAVRWKEKGYRALKVKVGQGDVGDDIGRIRAIRDALDAFVPLRADANRAWSLGEAVTFAENTEDLALAYVEEPLTNPARLHDLMERTNLPVALDETTREATPNILQEMPDAAAVVLKPTLLGGLLETQSWYRTARKMNTTPVLSAAYESGIGLRMLVALAATGPDVPVGLSTYDRLAADVYTPPLPLGGPTVDVASVGNPSTSRVARDQLDLVEQFSA